MTFSEKLKQLRKRKGLTQRELANIIPTSFSTYRRWEKEGYSPALPLIARIAEVLDTSVAYLSGETDDVERQAQTTEPTVNEEKTKLNMNEKLSYKTELNTNRGMLVYELGNGRKIQVPATPEYAPQFWAFVNRSTSLQPAASPA